MRIVSMLSTHYTTLYTIKYICSFPVTSPIHPPPLILILGLRGGGAAENNTIKSNVVVIEMSLNL